MWWGVDGPQCAAIQVGRAPLLTLPSFALFRGQVDRGSVSSIQLDTKRTLRISQNGADATDDRYRTGHSTKKKAEFRAGRCFPRHRVQFSAPVWSLGCSLLWGIELVSILVSNALSGTAAFHIGIITNRRRGKSKTTPRHLQCASLAAPGSCRPSAPQRHSASCGD